MSSRVISIIDVENNVKPTKDGKRTYNELVVTYKDSEDKVNGKKLLSFGAGAEVYKVLSGATKGQVFTVETVKNDAGFWDWVSATTGSVQAPPVAAATSASHKTSYASDPRETPEERAAKQVMIVRQSSLAQAVAFVSVFAPDKEAVTPEMVIDLAKEFEAYVFDTNKVNMTVLDIGTEVE